ncbi:MAG: glycosyltransferase family 2 protein [Bacteroidota bacterium]
MLVSICIPCYNAALFLPKTLPALLQQSHQNLEIIIIDDGSTDSSIKIIQEFAEKDQRIQLEIATSKGASAARNQAYNLSKGDCIVFFDADDWIPENFITSQLQTLKSDQDVVVAKWGRFYENELSTINIDQSQLNQDFSFQDWILNYWINISHMTCPGRVLIPKAIIEHSGLWDEDLSLNDDFTFFTRIFSNSKLIRYNANSTFYYRSGINGLSSKKGDQAYESLFNSLTRAINVAQSKLQERNELNICYANLLQNFIYETYPYKPDLINKANDLIKTLGGSNLKFPAGGKTKLINSIFGWKLVKKIKNLTA